MQRGVLEEQKVQPLPQQPAEEATVLEILRDPPSQPSQLLAQFHHPQAQDTPLLLWEPLNPHPSVAVEDQLRLRWVLFPRSPAKTPLQAQLVPQTLCRGEDQEEEARQEGIISIQWLLKNQDLEAVQGVEDFRILTDQCHLENQREGLM